MHWKTNYSGRGHIIYIYAYMCICIYVSHMCAHMYAHVWDITCRTKWAVQLVSTSQMHRKVRDSQLWQGRVGVVMGMVLCRQLWGISQWWLSGRLGVRGGLPHSAHTEEHPNTKYVSPTDDMIIINHMTRQIHTNTHTWQQIKQHIFETHPNASVHIPQQYEDKAWDLLGDIGAIRDTQTNGELTQPEINKSSNMVMGGSRWVHDICTMVISSSRIHNQWTLCQVVLAVNSAPPTGWHLF